MKYYYDTEFLEGTQTKSILGIPFGKTKPTIDLISIGLVSEDNRELYLISKDFNLKEAWNRYDLKQNQGCGDANNLPPRKVYWIRENVLFPIWVELWCKDLDINHETVKQHMTDTASAYPAFTFYSLKYLINKYGKTNKQIAEDVKEFVYCIKNIDAFPTKNGAIEKMNIQFYGYYSAYDHCALAWLFGKMIDLPNGFPMYTRDLKQMLDEKVEVLKLNRFGLLYERSREHDSPISIERLSIEEFYDYPKETNSHHSLSDAKWNKALYEFLNNL